MINPSVFKNVLLQDGFLIAEVELTHGPMRDALEREAVAQTRIFGRTFHITIQAGLSDREVSISLYRQ